MQKHIFNKKKGWKVSHTFQPFIVNISVLTLRCLDVFPTRRLLPDIYIIGKIDFDFSIILKNK